MEVGLEFQSLGVVILINIKPKMKKLVSLQIVLISIFLSACVPEEGPVVVNGTDRSIEVVARFDDNVTRSHVLIPGKVYWIGHEKSALIDLRISDEGILIHDLNEEYIKSLYKRSPQKTLVVIVESTIVRVVSKQDLKYFD